MRQPNTANSVLITGMHRSGTSMATRLLNLCGLHLGDSRRLLRAQPDNPQGFWENLDFVSLDDRILARMNSAWDLPPTGNPNPASDPTLLEVFRTQAMACSKVCREACAEACAEAHTEAAGASDPACTWGWKDPRCCLLLPFWSAVLPDLKVLICLRDPLEVAASLSKRNGFSTQLGLHLWQRYNQRLEKDLQDAPGIEAIVTHYEALLAHPEQELRRLTDWLGWQVAEETITEACASIKPELRHHRHHHQERERLLEAGGAKELVQLYDRMCKRAGPNYSAGAEALNKEDEALNNPSEALNKQGEARFAEGDFQGAAKLFQEVLIRDAGHLRGRNNLACALWQASRREEAVSALVAVLKQDPDDRDATWNLGQFLRQLGRREDARQLFQSYLDRNPEAGDINRELELINQ